MDVPEEPFVSETPGLQTTVIRAIHHMTLEDCCVRISTIDKIPRPYGLEHRINGEFLFRKGDLIRMIEEISDFLCKAAPDHIAEQVRDRISALKNSMH